MILLVNNLILPLVCEKGGRFKFFGKVSMEKQKNAKTKQEVNVALTLPRQAHKKEVEAGLVGKSCDIWAAASLPSKDNYCGLCFCFFRFRYKYEVKFLLAYNVQQHCFCMAESAIHSNLFIHEIYKHLEECKISICIFFPGQFSAPPDVSLLFFGTSNITKTIFTRKYMT